MLILARYVNETIMIGDDIQIKLVMLEKDRALIGIHAPKHIEIHRQEIYDRNKSLIKKVYGSRPNIHPIFLQGTYAP